MSTPLAPLLEVLRQVPDPRMRRGRRHPLAALLALACAAMLCGYRSYSAISEWGRNYDPAFLRGLGFTRATAPCAATLFQVFRRLDREEFERLLGAWAEQVLAATAPVAEEEALALDGKTLRGSQKQGAPAAHLLSVVSHRLGLTVGQAGVDAKTNEIPVAGVVLEGLVLEGRIFTMDALLTQRALAQQIVAGGGDYVMLAKGNQPTLEQDIATVFTAPPPLGSNASTPVPRTRGMGGWSGVN
jgi:hypothetical protein